MLMGFLGCIGAVNEVRCLLGMVSMVLHHRPPSLPHPAQRGLSIAPAQPG